MSGSRDLDVIEAHDGIDVDRMALGALAHHLPVDLAFGRHVDDEIAADPAPGSRAAGRAGERRACRHNAARPRSRA